MKRKIWILVIIFVILLFVSLGFLFYTKRLKIAYDKEKIVSLNDEVYNVDFITKLKNGKIVTKKALLDTKTIGTKDVQLKIQYFFKREKIYTFKLKVIDTEAPVIDCPKNISVTEGTKIDLLTKVSAKDNYDNDVKVTVEGEYNLRVPGKYKIYYVAKDSSLNETRKECILTVTKKVYSQNIKINNGTDNYVVVSSKGFKIEVKNGVTYIDGTLVVNKTYSLPKNYGSDLTSETKNAFKLMQNAAKKDNLNLTIISGFRSYNFQSSLYNNYVSKHGQAMADTFSARAGYSEHQTGLAMDLNQISDSFGETKVGKWLDNNAYKYGFILRYPKGKSNETGYKYEPWHFRYVGVSLATKLYNNGNWITIESYYGITSKYE